VGGTASALAAGLAAPAAISTYAPLHAFGWPASGIPNDPLFASQTDLAQIDLKAAWRTTTGSASVVVAVLDTGLDAANPEFSGRIVPGYNALTGAEDAPSDFTATLDDSGHGTHVSGTIAAAANNAVGIAGIATQTSIMPVKVMNAKGVGDFATLATGLKWAVAHGATIVTLSLGGVLPPQLVSLYQAPFDAAVAAGVVVVAAAGNDGGAATEYPCNFPNVICVGSTTNDGSAVSTFSTSTSGLTLVAPGEGIVSTVPGNHYQAWSGTSMATPHVTAAVALMRAVSPSLGVAAVKDALEHSARPLVTGGQNPDSGFGLLQVGAAVAIAAAGSVPSPSPSASPSPSPSPSPSASPSPGSSPDPSASPSPDANASPSPMPPDGTTNPTPSPPPSAVPALATPTVTSVTPGSGARNVARSLRPRVTFSVPVTGISARTVLLADVTTGRSVPVRLAYSASTRTVTLTPLTRLAATHTYRISVTSAVAAADGGLHLRRTFTATFRTGVR
jgi:subtilisin family serine protease